MTDVRFDRAYRYDDLTAILRSLADEHPGLMSLDAIGSSHEGRDIWLATITDARTGDATDKPGVWIEGNIHAAELAGGIAALHLIWTLVSRADDPTVRRVLETRTFYVVPRLNPDGVEWALADQPRIIRSSTRAYPYPQERDGLHREDVDGDGRLLTMRIRDDNGPWKIHPDEPRLMIRREIDEDDASTPYYRLLPEGAIRNYDGVMVELAPSLQGLDLNRNFPAEWAPEGTQQGAGPYPTSEPEIRAEVQAVVERPNVCAYLSYHTFAGAHLRPYADRADDAFPTHDLLAFKTIGDKATSITGYPAVSINDGFRYDPKAGIHGGSIDWFYDHLGLIAWTTELWNPMAQAGIDDPHPTEWYQDHPVEDDLTLLRWNDEVLDGRGFVDWYAFDHPQLGPVELGGWNTFEGWANPPPAKMLAEVEPQTTFALSYALTTPLLRVRSVESTQLAEGLYRVRAVIENAGWLPTNVTDKALERNAVRPVRAHLDLPDGAEVDGPVEVEMGQLTGRVDKRSFHGFFRSPDSTTDRAKAEWIVRGPAGATLTVIASHERAGTVRAEVVLG